MDVITVNSESEDEAVPPPPTTSGESSSGKIVDKVPFGLASSSASSLSSTPYASAASTPTRMNPFPRLSPTSSNGLLRRRKRVKKRVRINGFFPILDVIEERFRSVLGINYSQAKVMKITQDYIRCLRDMHDEVVKFPNKCHLLARSVSRTTLLIRTLSKHFSQTAYYLQKICEILALYVFLELRFAAGFCDSKTRIAERIINLVLLHLGSADITYVLRIFAYIPYMGKESEIVTKIFKRLIPEPILIIKNEFHDRLYIQYLIAFYHWKDAQTLHEDQQRVINFANRFMKPMHTLKSSLLYARHLPSYVKREDATAYFLSNLVFFNDLRNASLLDGVAEILPDMIDLSDDMDSLTIDLSAVREEHPVPLTTVKLEEQTIVATVDLTEGDDEVPWLKRLARKAMEVEVQLPHIFTSDPKTVDVVDLESSDDEAWTFNDRITTEKPTLPATLDLDESSIDSFDRMYEQLEMSLDIPENTSSDELLKELTHHIDACMVDEVELSEEDDNADKDDRLTFRGIAEREFKKTLLQKSKSAKSSSSHTANKDNEELNGVKEQVVKETVPIPTKSVHSDPERVNGLSREIEQSALRSETTDKEQEENKKKQQEEKRQKEYEKQKQQEKEIEKQKELEKQKEREKRRQENRLKELENQRAVETPMVAEDNRQKESKETRQLVENILRDFAEFTTSLSGESSDEENKRIASNTTESMEVGDAHTSEIVESHVSPSPITGDETIIDSSVAEKEAVTLTLDNYLFDPSEEGSETFRSRFPTSSLKTYSRKDMRKTSETAIKNTTAEKEPERNIQNVATVTAGRIPPNILFSGRVISLREDDGSMTPSYLKIPESVEISSQGSNVVFSMQGRRLSSFPPLEITATNGQTMPDFDTDLFSDSEAEVEQNVPHKAKGDKSSRKKVVSNKSNSRQNDGQEFEKPIAKRRNVWFSDKTEIREISPRENVSPSDYNSPINTLTSTINKIALCKQQYQPSTLSTVQQSDHISLKKTPSSYTTPATSIAVPTTLNALKRSNTNSNALATATTIGTPTAATTAATSSDTASLKSAQEQDLVQRLFPELFVSSLPKPQATNHRIGNTSISNNSKPSKANNPLKTPTMGVAVAPTINQNQNKFNPAYSTKSSNRSFSPNVQEKQRRKSVTPVPPSNKPQLSEFDRYLENLKKRRTTHNKTQESNNTMPKQREKARRPISKGKSPVNVATKSLVDITNDIKLTKMQPVVVVERLSETIYRAKMYGTIMTTSDGSEASSANNKLSSQPSSQSTPSVEILLKVPIISAPVTKSLSDILTDVVEQEHIVTTASKELPLPADKTARTDIAREHIPIVENEKQTTDQFLPPPPIGFQDTTPATTIAPQSETTEIKPPETKPPVEADPSKTEVKSIKTEELDMQTALQIDFFKRPQKLLTSRTTASPRNDNGSPQCFKEIKTAPESPHRVNGPVPSTCTESQSLANRLGSLMPQQTTENLPPTSIQPKSVEQTTSFPDKEPDRDSIQRSLTPTILNSPRKQVKVRLKRHKFKDNDEYVVVSNSVFDDTDCDGSDWQTIKAHDRLSASSDNEREVPHSERRRRLKRSAARKGQALKRIFDRVADDKMDPPRPPTENPRVLGSENNKHLFNGATGHNIDSISTPPPTPPSPSTSPAHPPTVDKNPTGSEDTSKDTQRLADGGQGVKTAEPNNNHVHPSFRSFARQNGETSLSNYLITSSDMVQEFRKHTNLPTEIEIDSNFLAIFYEYLVERKDDRAMEEIHKIMPLLKIKLFNSLGSSEPHLHQRRYDPCNLATFKKRRSRKLSTSEANNEDPSNDSTWSCILSKRRKTISFDSHYLVHSPDFLFDEEICSASKVADSPTIEVMRLHTGKRDSPPKPLTMTDSSRKAEREAKKSTEANGINEMMEVREEKVQEIEDTLMSAGDVEVFQEIESIDDIANIGVMDEIGAIAAIEEIVATQVHEAETCMILKDAVTSTVSVPSPQAFIDYVSTSSRLQHIDVQHDLCAPLMQPDKKAKDEGVVRDDDDKKDDEREGSPSRHTECKSPPEFSHKLVVSRTYSINNMVQNVFVPPEIEKYIEEESSTTVVEKSNIDTNTTNNTCRTSTKNRCRLVDIDAETAAAVTTVKHQRPRSATKKSHNGRDGATGKRRKQFQTYKEESLSDDNSNNDTADNTTSSDIDKKDTKSKNKKVKSDIVENATVSNNLNIKNARRTAAPASHRTAGVPKRRKR